MYSLKKVHKIFLDEVQLLEAILDDLSNKPDTYERTVFIHGSFLRIIVVWERFIESLFTSALCGATTISGKEIKPKIARIINREKAFDFLRKEGNRKTPYLDWLATDIIQARVDRCFHHSSRLHKLHENSATYTQIIAIRNHIAHDSKSSLKKLHDSVIQQNSYLSILGSPSPNPAQILVSISRTNSLPFYKNYIRHYTFLAEEMVK